METTPLEFNYQETGPKGFPTVKRQGRFLHSPYNPLSEVSRYLDIQNIQSHIQAPRIAIVLGELLGFFSQELQSRGYKQIFSFFPNSILARNHGHFATHVWYPGCSLNWELTLDSYLTLETVNSIDVLIWPQGLEGFSSIYEPIQREIMIRIKQMQGNRAHFLTFGPKMFKNIMHNAQYQSTRTLVKGKKPIILAASGPSLSKHKDFLQEHKNKINLWALPSSLHALKTWKITPEAVVTTDPGYYAQTHLHSIPRTTTLIYPLSAGLPTNIPSDHPRFVFNQNSYWESQILPSTTPRIPSQGTVAISALRLALLATSGPIYVLGLDLSQQGFVGHVHPHTWSSHWEATSHRLNSIETLLTNRLWQSRAYQTQSGEIFTPILATYAQWLQRSSTYFENRIFRICPSQARWNSMIELNSDEFKSIFSEGYEIHFTSKNSEPFSSIDYENFSRENWNKGDFTSQELSELFASKYPKDWLIWAEKRYFSTLNKEVFDDISPWEKELFDLMQKKSVED